MNFRTPWDPESLVSFAQENTEPSCTVPDQSLSIPEIIARYTRTGLVPSSYTRRDEGGNIAAEPDSDPLDDFTELMSSAARNAAKSKKKAQETEVSEPSSPGPSEEGVTPPSEEP